jgi:hypothetical protein
MRSRLSDDGWQQIVQNKIQLPLIYCKIFAEPRSAVPRRNIKHLNVGSAEPQPNFLIRLRSMSIIKVYAYCRSIDDIKSLTKNAS